MLAVDLVNTSPLRAGHEGLTHVDELAALVAAHGFTTLTPAATDAELVQARGLRSIFDAVLTDPTSHESVTQLNSTLLTSGSVPQLASHAGHTGLAGKRGLHLHYAPEDSTFINRMGALCAVGVAMMIESGDDDRLKVCEAPDCIRLFLDMSRNGSRRYCDGRTCGNRLHAARYRARQAENA